MVSTRRKSLLALSSSVPQTTQNPSPPRGRENLHVDDTSHDHPEDELAERFPILGIKRDEEKWMFSANVDGKQLPMCIVGSISEAANVFKRAAYVCGRRFITLSLSRREKVELRELSWNEFFKREKLRLYQKTYLNFTQCDKEFIEREFEKGESLELQEELACQILKEYSAKKIFRDENEVSEDELLYPEPDSPKMIGVKKKTWFVKEKIFDQELSNTKEKWQVTVHYKKKNYYLGCLDTKEEAILLYDKAAYLLGKKMNYDLPEEEKAKLEDVEWEDFLETTRTMLGIRIQTRTTKDRVSAPSESEKMDVDGE